MAGKTIETNKSLFKELVEVEQGLEVECIQVKRQAGDANDAKAYTLARSVSEKLVSCLALTTRPNLTQNGDEKLVAIKNNLNHPKYAHSDFLIDVKLYYADPIRPLTDQKRLSVPQSSRKLILSIAHDDPIYGGHLGIKKTKAKLAKYNWPKFNNDIEDYIKSCQVCQHHKNFLN